MIALLFFGHSLPRDGGDNTSRSIAAMSWIIVGILAVLSAVLMLIESRWAPLTVNLRFKGDLKRESRWFAQYGQAACTIFTALIIWRLDGRDTAHGWHPAIVLLAAVFGTSIVCTLMKRLVGRVRPNREQAGRFLGPGLRHANYRESFPSSHSACAFAMSSVLAHLYPPAAAVFWVLAFICAALRYLMDAHWLSDVVAGVTLGLIGGGIVWHFGG